MTVEKSGVKIAVERSDAFAVRNANWKVTFEKLSGNKRIVVTKKGDVKLRVGLKAGKTYKAKVKVTAAGNGTYAAKSTVVTLKVKAKKHLS